MARAPRPRARPVDADHDPDLFWALRGGGGSFGVVTAIELELFELGTVYGGSLFWPFSAAPAVLRAWYAWQATAPDTITTSFRILCLPPLPEVPEPRRAAPAGAVRRPRRSGPGSARGRRGRTRGTP